MYLTEPDPGLNGRRLRYPRGKVLGGCSSINGMIYMRGQARDYDAWAELTGDDAWSWANALPDFIAHESHWRLDAGGDAGLRAASTAARGEWRVERQRLRWDILEAFVAACVEAGIPRAGRLQRRRQRGRRLLRGQPARRLALERGAAPS